MLKPPYDPYSPQSSPKKQPPSPKQSRDQLPLDMQYRLQKVFEEARNREEKYIDIIKNQEIKRKEEAEQYLATLRHLKKEFIDYMELKKPKKDKIWKTALDSGKIEGKKEVTRLNSLEFNLSLLDRVKVDEQQSVQVQLQPRLDCKLTFYYLTLLFKDYVRQTIPEQLILTLRTVYPQREFAQDLLVIKEEDEVSTINNLIEHIPFQISTPDHAPITFEFSIPCTQQALNYYRDRQFQLQLINKKGLFVYAFSKLNLSSLLYYENQPTEWKLRPLQFYSPLNGRKICTLSVKLQNKLSLSESQKHYKIQCNTPMQLGSLKSGISYNDDQSRMIQRISKFKTAHNSLLLGIGSVRQANAERFFQNQNDKIVLMHRKKKELESIQEYKNTHKEELMGKLLDDAINRYYSNQCEIGCPKYMVFHHYNSQKQHRKVTVKATVKMVEKNGGKNIKEAAIEENIVVNIVRPEHFQVLVQKQLIKLQNQAHFEYQMDEEDNIWTMSGMIHPIVVRVICFPPKMAVLSPEVLQNTYQLKVVISDEYDREIDSFHSKLKLSGPSIQHKLYFHGYFQDETSFQIPFQQKQDPFIAKNILTNNQDLLYSWDQTWATLSVKLKHGQPGQKSFYLIINDAQHLFQIGCYQIVVFTYAKLSKNICIGPGEVKKINLDFSLNDKILTEMFQKKQKEGLQKISGVTDQLRVFFSSSCPEHCFVRCQNQSEILIKANKIYQVQVRLQSYDHQTNPQKIIIHAVDLDRNIIIKRWLIELQKEEIKFEKTAKLHIQHGKTIRYRFELLNNDHKERNFRLYSSNLGILTVPMQLVSLLGNQVVDLDLSFVVKQQITGEELARPLNIILTVTDGQEFLYYLFQLTVEMK